jgi:hypothetical protein
LELASDHILFVDFLLLAIPVDDPSSYIMLGVNLSDYQISSGGPPHAQPLTYTYLEGNKNILLNIEPSIQNLNVFTKDGDKYCQDANSKSSYRNVTFYQNASLVKKNRYSVTRFNKNLCIYYSI